MRKVRKKRRRTAAAGRQKQPPRRISTQRRTPVRRRSSTSRAASPGTRARALAGDTLQITFDLRDVSGRPLRDPETFFTFRRLSDGRQIGDQVELELTGVPVGFRLPVSTGEVAVCEVDAKRFRFSHSPVFFRSPGPPIHKQIQLLREPKEWTPRFTPWSALAETFGDLKRVLARSPKVTLFREVDPIADLLVDAAYDGISAEPLAPAKTALLNTYFRLSRVSEPVSGNRPWFSFVIRLIAIGRERFLAFVDPEMETLVRQIHVHIDQFRGDYERTPAENHRGNVPTALQARVSRMISLKSAQRQGNFQLTLTHLSGPDEVLLDADIDENGSLLRHFLDLFKHRITGGTHPHDIHEILTLQEGQAPGFDLGYRLE